MRNTCFISLLFVTLALPVLAQTKTTDALQKANSEALVFFFYNNTLRMLNQKDDPAFDALIKDVEKMKFLIIEKANGFDAADYKKLASGYKAESYDAIMTSRYEGRNFDVFLKDSNGKTAGMVVTVNDSTNLYVLDIVGSVALDKVTKFFSTIDESSDIAEKVRDLAKNH
jgi:hypothetical protein